MSVLKCALLVALPRTCIFMMRIVTSNFLRPVLFSDMQTFADCVHSWNIHTITMRLWVRIFCGVSSVNFLCAWKWSVLLQLHWTHSGEIWHVTFVMNPDVWEGKTKETGWGLSHKNTTAFKLLLLLCLSKSKWLRWVCHFAHVKEKQRAHRTFVARPERKRPLGSTRRRWENNIKMDLKDINWKRRWLVDMARDWDKWLDLMNAVVNFRVP